MTEYNKDKVGTKVTHTFTDPTDVVIEKINDEYIIEIDCGMPSERTFTFMKVFVDVFYDDEIRMSMASPDQFESFDTMKYLEIEYVKDQGIGAVEFHY